MLPAASSCGQPQGLLDPMLDGVWGKVAPRANESCLIVAFGEHNVDQAIARTKERRQWD